MRQLFFIFFLIIGAACHVTAQNLELFMEPSGNLGYVAWKCNDPNKKYVDIRVYQKTLVGGLEKETLISQTRVSDKNYSKIPSKYWDGQDGNFYRIDIVSVNGNGGDIVVLPIDDGTGAIKKCYWQCESGNYAYRIQQLERLNTSNPYRYRIDFAFDEDVESANVPIYRWMSFTEFEYYLPYEDPDEVQADPAYHDLPGWHHYYYSENGLGGTQVIKLDNDGTYADITGATITGSHVYGVQKGRGDYSMENTVYVVQTPYMTADYCSLPSTYDLSTFQPLFQTPLSNIGVTGLACTGNFYEEGGSNSGPSGPGGGTTPGPPSICFTDIPGIPGLAGTQICLEAGTVGSYGGGGASDPNSSDIYQYLSYLNINRLDEAQGVVNELNILGSEMFDGNGEPNFPSYTLDPGIYEVMFKFDGQNLNRVFWKVEQTITETIPYSNYVDVTPFPNPLKNNDWNIHLESTATLNFTYEITDSNGNSLFQTNMQIRQGHDKDHYFNPGITLPNGMLYNVFKFEDGSVLTEPMIKM